MKIRKLIFSAKLEQIEKKNQNIFIFHCSANAAQWRYLKNFLYHKTRSEVAPNQSQKASLQSPQQLSPMGRVSGVCKQTRASLELVSLARSARPSVLRAYTFFQSNGKKKLVLTEGSEGLRSAREATEGLLAYKERIAQNRSQTRTNTSRNRIYRAQILPSSTKSAYNKSKPKGCLFFFDTSSQTVIETHQKNSLCFELINKIESIELNKNFILLYGQMNSTVVNHVDVKEALNLDTQATYQQLFTSMHSASLGLSFCLDQQIGEFLSIQESRAKLVDNN